MKYTVYKITNEVNGKIYIGKHQTENLDDNYMGSGIYLKRAQEKYGIENFTKDYLFIFETKEEMDIKEKELVNEEFVDREDTYNANQKALSTQQIKVDAKAKELDNIESKLKDLDTRAIQLAEQYKVKITNGITKGMKVVGCDKCKNLRKCADVFNEFYRIAITSLED